MKEVKTYARVQITLEVDLNSPWDDSVSVSRIHATAKKEAVENVERLIGTKARIVGVPKVIAVMVEEKE